MHLPIRYAALLRLDCLNNGPKPLSSKDFCTLNLDRGKCGRKWHIELPSVAEKYISSNESSESSGKADKLAGLTCAMNFRVRFGAFPAIISSARCPSAISSHS